MPLVTRWVPVVGEHVKIRAKSDHPITSDNAGGGTLLLPRDRRWWRVEIIKEFCDDETGQIAHGKLSLPDDIERLKALGGAGNNILRFWADTVDVETI